MSFIGRTVSAFGALDDAPGERHSAAADTDGIRNAYQTERAGGDKKARGKQTDRETRTRFSILLSSHSNFQCSVNSKDLALRQHQRPPLCLGGNKKGPFVGRLDGFSRL
ncbi:unnamed protein product, partial [Iphiclides podalirius]